MAAQVRVQVPSSVARWSTRPAPFSSRKHSTNVKFSVDNTVAERVGEWDTDAVVYTADPVPFGRVWQTTILGTSTTGWGFGLVSGSSASCNA